MEIFHCEIYISIVFLLKHLSMKTCSFGAMQQSESEIGNIYMKLKYVKEENIIIAVLAMFCNLRLRLTFQS